MPDTPELAQVRRCKRAASSLNCFQPSVVAASLMSKFSYHLAPTSWSITAMALAIMSIVVVAAVATCAKRVLQISIAAALRT
jgi:hypothetical protein